MIGFSQEQAMWEQVRFWLDASYGDLFPRSFAEVWKNICGALEHYGRVNKLTDDECCAVRDALVAAQYPGYELYETSYRGASSVYVTSSVPVQGDLMRNDWGYDAVLCPLVMGSMIRIDVHFRVHHAYAYNPVAVLREVCGRLVPVSHAWVGREVRGDHWHEIAIVGLQEGEYVEIRPSGITRVVLRAVNGTLLQYVSEGDVVLGIIP